MSGSNKNVSTFGGHEIVGTGRLFVNFDDYLRDEARKYRELAEQAKDPLIKKELMELAAICEEVANHIEDRMTAG
jgi:hypothetical protein